MKTTETKEINLRAKIVDFLNQERKKGGTVKFLDRKPKEVIEETEEYKLVKIFETPVWKAMDPFDSTLELKLKYRKPTDNRFHHDEGFAFEDTSGQMYGITLQEYASLDDRQEKQTIIAECRLERLATDLDTRRIKLKPGLNYIGEIGRNQAIRLLDFPDEAVEASLSIKQRVEQSIKTGQNLYVGKTIKAVTNRQTITWELNGQLKGGQLDPLFQRLMEYGRDEGLMNYELQRG